ncbi:hypothetical protein EYF80_005744 [Liparis tanakae]|uniref:Uncharacterized protein n=1 Tax=Liparis tanakae TaxID=230148 RepID=A0A4Z2J304_9TELE|nr:hypothetical protein EYF80_005744 [Liparis tanakae]
MPQSLPTGVNTHILHHHGNGRGGALLQCAEVNAGREQLESPRYDTRSCVNGIFEWCGERSVLEQFPDLQDFRAASERLPLCCRTTGPVDQGQTSSHADAKRRTGALLLE